MRGTALEGLSRDAVVVAVVSEIGPGFSPDIKLNRKMGFSPRDMFSALAGLAQILKRAALLLAALCIVATPAQTLARPGWAGSGIGAEAWWRSAVFYRLAVPAFQDSDGDGFGDLNGVTQRLDYLQSLGIDAIILPTTGDEASFDNLIHEASSRHIRIVIELRVSSAEVLGQVRLWLTRGAAGISVVGAFQTPGDEAAAHLPELAALVNSFPGQRVLVARPYSNGQITRANAAHLVGQIINLPPFFFTTGVHNTALEAAHLPLPTGSSPMLQTTDTIVDMFGDETPRGVGMQKIIAARLLLSPGAAYFNWGQELGLERPRGEVPNMVMQWTPSNITPPTPELEAEPKPAEPPPDPNVYGYGAFKPYVAPKPVKKPPPPGARPDPNTLPGFTSGTLHADMSPNGATANVAVENADPNSLLNFYRRLIQLHHDNASIRSGAEISLNHDADNALVWVRRAPAGATTAGNVIVTCNLGDKPLTLSLDPDLATLHIHPGTLRPLAGSWTATPISQYSNHITLPPYSVFIGELRN